MSYSPNFRGSTSKAPSRQNETGYQNGTVLTIALGSAVSTNVSSQLVLTDVSDESTVESWVGMTTQTIPSLASGLVVSDGRMENIPSGFGFSIGDTIWVGTTPGSLTNVKPDLTAPGWLPGYFVLFVGVVVKNEFNALNLDIQLCRQIVGQL